MEQPVVSPEIWTMIAVGLVIVGLVFRGQMVARQDSRDNRAEIAALRKETAAEIAALRKETAGEFAALRKETAGEFAALRGEMADRHRELGDRIAGLGERVAGVEAELRLATELLRDLLGRRNAPGATPEQAD